MSFLAGLYSPEEDQLYSTDVDLKMNQQIGYQVNPVYDYKLLSDTFESLQSFLSKEDEEKGFIAYLPLLPVNEIETFRRFNLGETETERLFSNGDGSLFVKWESEHPAGSILDRGSFVLSAIAAENQRPVLFSAGIPYLQYSLFANSSNIIETYLGISSYDFNSKMKTYLGEAGTQFCEFKANREQVMEFLENVDSKDHSYQATPSLNPYFGEGIKTVAYEIAYQLEELPDVVLIPPGMDTVARFVKKGFAELETLGWIDPIPEVWKIDFRGGHDTLAFNQGSKIQNQLAGNYFESVPNLMFFRNDSIAGKSFKKIKLNQSSIENHSSTIEADVSICDKISLTAGLELLQNNKPESVVCLSCEPFKNISKNSNGEEHRIPLSGTDFHEIIRQVKK